LSGPRVQGNRQWRGPVLLGTTKKRRKENMMRYLFLWLLGVPVSVLVVLYFLGIL
jgi:hypothetical protein